MGADYFTVTPAEYSKKHGTPGGGVQLTKQADKEAADINVIVRNYGTSGQFAHINPIEPRYQDNTAVTDLIEARNLWNEAVAHFETLPADVRAMANNDPIQFIEMTTDPNAMELLKKKGLPVKEPVDKTLTESLLEKLVANTNKETAS